MGFTAAIGASALLSAGTSIYTSQKAAGQADELAKKQKAAQDAALQQATDQKNNADATENANALRDSQKSTLQTKALSTAGRAGTILTSPLGVTGTANSSGDQSTMMGNKTLLGA